MIWSDMARLTIARATGALMDGGCLRFFNDRDEPVAQWTFGDPAWSGDKPHITPEKAAPGSGTMTSFALYMRDGKTVVGTGSVGPIGSGSDVEFKDCQCIKGARVDVESFTFRAG